jgi:hypothetical protein
MVQRVSTVAFEGIEARAVDVQVQVAPGLPAFAIVKTINPSARLASVGTASVHGSCRKSHVGVHCSSLTSLRDEGRM